VRDSDKSRCRGDTPRQPLGYADLIKAKKPASVDRRQHRAKLDRVPYAARWWMHATSGRHGCIGHDVWVSRSSVAGKYNLRSVAPARSRARFVADSASWKSV
jgi:hypothetical protein